MSTGTYVFGSSESAFYESKSWSGEDTPKSLRDRRILTPDNAYSFTKLVQTQGPKARLYHIGLGTTITVFPVPGVVQFKRAGVSSVGPIASELSSLLAKFRQTDLNLGVSGAEGMESLEMVAGRLKSILGFSNALRKGNLGAALRHIGPVPKAHKRRAQKRLQHGDVSGSFLELHLGWTPLISDIYAAADIKPVANVAKLTSKTNYGTPQSFTVNADYVSVFSKKHHRLTSKLVMEVENSPDFFERFGLRDPASIVWELVPFSFVVDYFVPIGDTISALHAISAIKRNWVLRKTSEVYEGKIDIPTGFQSAPKGYRFLTPASASYKFLKYNRIRPNLSAYNIVAQSITASVPDSIWQIGTLGALVHSSLSKIGKGSRPYNLK